MTTASRMTVVIMMAAGLSAQSDEAIRDRDAAIRAFRDFPSVGTFSEAGTAIMSASDFRPFESDQPRPPGRDREFEAMKARLAAGIVVSTSHLPAMSSASSHPDERVTLEMLPAARPSFFRGREPLFVVALRPFTLVEEDVITLVDALSAVNRLTMRVRVAEPMSFGPHGPLGAWDVGAVEARFEREALVHGVTGRGRATGYRVRSVKAPIGHQRCGDVGGSVIGTRVTPDWASSTVAWIGKPTTGTATVTTRALGGTGVYDKLVTETIDLDRDGVPDFSTWAGIDKSDIVEDVDIPWKAVFVNVDGRWMLGSYRAEADCT